ncbi:hypothetical protein C8F01DRAFT_980057 [Mycena amicta]|nr:hypothetical protein C8F01DRAFT_980057 [Mycena amicta]
MFSAFFYGTLMHPRILTRVVGDGSHLQISPAILLNYTRHRVRYADYPGILPYSEASAFFELDFDREACSVRGTMVTGLTAQDMEYLDAFESDEYKRQKVPVHPLGNLVALADYTMAIGLPTSLPSDEELQASVEVDTYVYLNPNNLLPDIWDFDEFVAQNAWKWISRNYAAREYEDSGITEVERRRAAGTTAVIV